MKAITFVLLTILCASCTDISKPNLDEGINYDLNPIIGNESLNHVPKEELIDMCEMEKIRTHLSYVHDRLVDQSANFPEQVKKKRLALLSILSDYIAAENYPLNEAYEGRRPCFIDAQGTYCAVGHLVKETAGEATAKAINEKHQYDYIYDMEMADLEKWISESGFSKHEIAMIQPTYDFNRKRNYHTVSMSNEVRNGNLPNFGWGYHYVKYWPQGSRLGGHFMKSYGAVVNHYRNGNWSAGLESERSLFALKRIGLSLNSGLGARYANLDKASFVQGVPSASLNLVVRKTEGSSLIWQHYINTASRL